MSAAPSGVLGKRSRMEGRHPPVPLKPPKASVQRYCDVLRVPREDTTAPPLYLPPSTPTADLDRDHALLCELLHPLPAPELFLERYWGRKPLAVLGVGASRVAQLNEEAMFGLDVKELMVNSASDSIFVWMKEQPPSSSSTSSSSSPSTPSLSASLQATSPPISSFPLDNPNQLDAALVCYNAGASLYFRSSPALSRVFVRALNSALGYGLWGQQPDGSEKGEIEVFCSRKGHYTPFHTDFQDNFTIQLSGKKTWIFNEQLSARPLRGWTPHYRDRSAEEAQRKVHAVHMDDPKRRDVPEDGDRVTLCAGDVLYHPPGVWHAVYCDEDSVSINVSLVATTYADVVADAVRQRLWGTEEGRMPVSFIKGQQEDGLDRLKRVVNAAKRALKTMPNPLIPYAWKGWPPPKIVEVKKGTEERVGKRIDVFYLSKLWVILELHGQEDAEEEDEDEEEEEEEVEVEEMKAKDAEDGEGVVRFACHFLFANEGLDSARRVELRVPTSYAVVVRDLAEIMFGGVEEEGAEDEGAREELKTAVYARTRQWGDEEGVQRVLRAMQTVGVLVDCQEEDERRVQDKQRRELAKRRRKEGAPRTTPSLGASISGT